MSKPQKAKAVTTPSPTVAPTEAPAAPATQETPQDQNPTDGASEAPAEGAAQQDATDAQDAGATSTEGAAQSESGEDKKDEPASTVNDPAAAADEPAAVPTAVEAADDRSAVDKAIEHYLVSPNRPLKTLAIVLKAYREHMGKSKATDFEVQVDQQVQLWTALRSSMNSGDAFRDCFQFLVETFRENQDGAFELHMLMRGVDSVRSPLNQAHRKGYVGLVTVLTAAAGLNNPKDVGRQIDLNQALNSDVFTSEARQRLIGLFTA